MVMALKHGLCLEYILQRHFEGPDMVHLGSRPRRPWPMALERLNEWRSPDGECISRSQLKPFVRGRDAPVTFTAVERQYGRIGIASWLNDTKTERLVDLEAGEGKNGNS
ncbi:hypothetical protein NCS52_01253500 [Fusarium sp. LHS14.1]|nr:hypothetical protein NCS52_01253500 [Fusarium sp. LHS14.1]